MIDYYSALPILSYNGILHFINSNRTLGKTWAFKIRAFKRGLKYGKKTIWIRRFKEEAKECAESFYSSKNLQKACGLIPYDNETNKGNFKQIGKTMFVKRRNKWVWFCKVVYLSKSNAMRSADDVDVDTIVFDEYTTTPERYKRYRGNEVTDFIDLFFSAKREHVVKIFMLGNNEHIINPYFDYFKIPALSPEFEGIRTFKCGSIVVQKINNKQRKNGDYGDKVKFMLDGTPYGDYIYNSEYKINSNVKIAKLPPTSTFYAQIVIDSTPIIIRFSNGYFYITNDKIEFSQCVFVLTPLNKYPNEVLLNRQTIQWLDGLKRAITYNLVRYSSKEIAERSVPLIKKLST